MLTALRHPACAGQQRRLSGHWAAPHESSEGRIRLRQYQIRADGVCVAE